MTEKNILLLIKEKDKAFQNKIINQLNENIFQPLECYLMDINWNNTILNNFNKDNYSEINPYFIDNFYLAINYLQKDLQFSFVDKQTIQLFFKGKELDEFHNISKIYVCNKKILIDFQGNDSNKSLLIINPFKQKMNRKNIFILVFNNDTKDKLKIYESLLSENINNLSDIDKMKEKYINNLIEFEVFLHNSFNYDNDNINNSDLLSQSIKYTYKSENDIKNILQILISFYYYEKYLSKKCNVFSEFQNYYLINYEWIQAYKKYYYYNYLYKLLNNYDSNNNINYLSLDTKMNTIIDSCYEEYRSLNITIGLNEELKNINKLQSVSYNPVNLKNLNYYDNCYVLPDKIIDKIIKIEFNYTNTLTLIKPKQLKSKDENIFLYIDSQNINYGFLNQKLLFQTKYILSYNSLEQYESEKQYLFTLSINDYIKHNNCNEKSNEIQIMKNNNDNNIGILLILTKNKFKHNSPNNDFMRKINIYDKYQKYTHSGKFSLQNSPKNRRIDNENHIKKLNITTNKQYNQFNTEQSNIYKKLTPFKKKKINIIYNNNIAKNKLKEKIKNLKENNEKYIQNEQNLNNKINMLEKQIEDNNNNIKNNNIIKQYINKINLLEVIENENRITIGEKEDMIRELNLKISLLEESENEKTKIIENNKNKEKELNEKISLLEKSQMENQKIKEENEKTYKLKNDELTNLINNMKLSHENEIKQLKERILLLEKENEKNKEEKEKICEQFKNENKIIIQEEKNKYNEIKEQCQKYIEENKILKEQNIKLLEKNKILEEEIKTLKNNPFKIMKDLFDPVKEIKFKKKKNDINNNINDQNININNNDNLNNILDSNTNNILKIINNNKGNNISNANIKMNNINSNINSNNLNDNNNNNNNMNKNINININNNYMNNNINDNGNSNLNYNENNIINNCNINHIINNNISINNNINNNINNINNINNSNNINIINNNNSNNFNNINNNSNNINNISNNSNPLDFSNIPPLVGLNNIGSTCYLNSTLQCLSQTKYLTDFFLDHNNEQLINNNNNININEPINIKLSTAYLDLIKQLWINDDDHSTYSPSAFKDTIIKMNPLLDNNETGNAKNLIIYILKQLHKELKPPKNINQNNNSQIIDYNQYDKKDTFLFFIKDSKQNWSIIYDIFYGFKETINECLYCKEKYSSQKLNNPICYNYELFNYLIFPLEEIKNIKYNSNDSNLQEQNNIQYIVSINDCFYYINRNEIFTDKNMGYCDICHQYYDSNYSSKIFYGPNVLILILNRGKDNICDIKLDFKENINITNYIIDKDMDDMIYDLYGVISYVKSEPSGYYIANCKNSVDNNWYRFNDVIISQIFNIQKDVMEYGTPYILFYKKQIYNKNVFEKYISA